MSSNGNATGFRPDELVKIQGRDFVVIGGRLRVLHANAAKVSIVTELIDYILDQHAVVRARVLTDTGEFTGTGVASATRDPKLTDALVELAETRAVARACRFAGVGVECVGFEELGAGAVLAGEPPRQELRSVPGQNSVTPQVGGNGSGSRGTPCTTAQRRALVALARQLGNDLDDVVATIYPGTNADHLTLPQASALIDKMKAKASNGAGAGR